MEPTNKAADDQIVKNSDYMVSPSEQITEQENDTRKWVTFRRKLTSMQPISKPFRFPRFSMKLPVNRATRKCTGGELPFALRAVLQISPTLLFKEVIVLKNETCLKETQIGYYICDEKGDRLFYVVHETSNLFSAFNALITIDGDNYVIKLNGKPIWASLIFNECLQIESPPGNQIGSVLIKFGYKSEYHVYETNETETALFVIKPRNANFLKSNCDHFLYDFNNQYGDEFGLITKNVQLLTDHQLKTTMHFGINFPQTLNTKSKTLLMCTALLIHIHRFQRNYR